MGFLCRTVCFNTHTLLALAAGWGPYITPARVLLVLFCVSNSKRYYSEHHFFYSYSSTKPNAASRRRPRSSHDIRAWSLDALSARGARRSHSRPAVRTSPNRQTGNRMYHLHFSHPPCLSFANSDMVWTLLRPPEPPKKAPRRKHAAAPRTTFHPTEEEGTRNSAVVNLLRAIEKKLKNMLVTDTDPLKALAVMVRDEQLRHKRRSCNA